MITSWMLFTVVVTALFSGAAWSMDRAFRPFAVPRRWIWAGGIVASMGLSLTFFLPRPAPSPVPVPPVSAPVVQTVGNALESVSVFATPAALPRNLDPWLIGGWGLLSLIAALVILRAFLKLNHLRSSWRRDRIDGHEVVISDGFGPALLGLVRPTIILPRWALEAAPEDRDLMIRHEQEHMAAGDAYLLAGALLLGVAFPWNVPIWWLGHRLRVAVEIDCDRRVLHRTPKVREYAELLLRIGSAGSIPGLRALAFSRPTSFLERRVRAMTDQTSPRLLRTMAFVCASVLLTLGACEMDRPAAPPQDLANQATVSLSDNKDPRYSRLTVKDVHRIAGERADRFTLTGVVFDGVDRQPVQGAQFGIEDLGVLGTTAADGYFHIEDIPAGSHTVSFEHPELGRTFLGLNVRPSGMSSIAGPPTGGSVTVWVKDGESGEPIRGAEVSIPAVDSRGQTNRNGGVSLNEVEPGPHLLRIEAPGYDPFEIEVEVIYWRTVTVSTELTK